MTSKQFFPLFFLSLLLACTSEQVHQQQETMLPDTTFIERYVSPYSYHAIYLDTNRQSTRYTTLMDMSFTAYDSTAFFDQHHRMTQKDPTLFTKHDLFDLPTHWLPLYPYQQQFHLYWPCDWSYVGQRILSDSAFIPKYGDGANPHAIQKVAQLAQQHYRIDMTEQEGLFYESIHIHVMDTSSFLSLWEFASNSEPSHYQVYVPQQAARQFPILVNDCQGDQEDEFNFDQWNYDSLRQYISK